MVSSPSSRPRSSATPNTYNSRPSFPLSLQRTNSSIKANQQTRVSKANKQREKIRQREHEKQKHIQAHSSTHIQAQTQTHILTCPLNTYREALGLTDPEVSSVNSTVIWKPPLS